MPLGQHDIMRCCLSLEHIQVAAVYGHCKAFDIQNYHAAARSSSLTECHQQLTAANSRPETSHGTMQQAQHTSTAAAAGLRLGAALLWRATLSSCS
jgi:hypothetical protein